MDLDNADELRASVMNYVRGQDAFDQDGDADIGELRDAVLGDIFHSGLAVVGPPTLRWSGEYGYGPPSTSGTFLYQFGTRDRVIYVGANDGMLHAFAAGTAGDNPDTTPVETDYYDPGTGEELFGYVPGLLLPTVKLVPRNLPRTYYFVDGTPTVADAWLGAGHSYPSAKVPAEWATVLVVGFREGGAGYMALDVTDPSATAAPHGPYPRPIWEFTHSKLGQAWSKPVITRINLRVANGAGYDCDGSGLSNCREQWVAIFGGGYRPDGDPNRAEYIADPADASWSDRSKALFMVSLDTGAVIASASFDSSDTSAGGLGQMKFSIPGSPGTLDLDSDGFADVVYIGDMGGQLWKWDISAIGEDTVGDPKVDNWTAGVIFRAYTTAVWSGGPSYFHSLPAAPTAAYYQNKLYLAFGTGERENLQGLGDSSTTLENNRLYVLRDDFPTGSGAHSTIFYEEALTDVTDVTAIPNSAQHGFFIRGEDGEKFVQEPLIFAGQVLATSYVPDTGGGAATCGATTGGGNAFLYVFDLGTASGFFLDAGSPTGYSRKSAIGGGLASRPQVLIDEEGGDKVLIKTSKGQVTLIRAPNRTGLPPGIIYWRQRF